MKKSNVEKKLNVIEEHVKYQEVQNKKELIKTGNVYNMDCYEGLCRIETGKITAFVSDVPYEMSVAGKKRTGTVRKICGTCIQLRTGLRKSISYRQGRYIKNRRIF